MEIPPKTDPRWRNALTGAEPKFSSLATRLLLTKLKNTLGANPAKLPDAISELHGFFQANTFAQRDIAAL